MTKPVDVYFNLDIDPWRDVPRDTRDGVVTRMGILPNGTRSGKPTVAILTEMHDGSVVVSQITWQQFANAAAALGESPTILMKDL